jgi:fatty-acid desaturase
MHQLPHSLKQHRVRCTDARSVVDGHVRYAPTKSLWFIAMGGAALIGGALTFSWAAFGVFLFATAWVLLFGHSLGSHRKLIHDSFKCPKWLEYLLVYFGVQVGLAGPLGLLRQHELRDFAQRLPVCHDYLRHGRGFWRDGWWQIHCDLVLDNPPGLQLEHRIESDRFYQFLERTWMLQQLPPALLLYALGGWGFVFWGVCARVTAGIFGHWLIGYFAHNHGPMHVEVSGAAVQGHNIRFTSLLTMGECWHNNHHAFPGSARLGLHPGEWDPGWWALTLLHKAGLVWSLRLPGDLPSRTELKQIDACEWTDAPVLANALSLHALLSVCWHPFAGLAGRWELTGPAANLPVRVFGSLACSKMRVICDPVARRLSLQNGALRVQGLPALLIATRLRSPLLTLPGLCLLPLAVLLERGRESLQGYRDARP